MMAMAMTRTTTTMLKLLRTSTKTYSLLYTSLLLLLLSLPTAHITPFAAAQTLSPSNNLTGVYATGESSTQLQLSPPFGTRSFQSPRFDLANLTANAYAELRGTADHLHLSIVYVAPNSSYSASAFSRTTIAILPCDPTSGYLTAVQILGDVLAASVPAVVLYSAVGSHCSLQTGGNIPSSALIYTTTNATDYLQIQAISTATSASWYIARESVLNNLTMSGSGNGGGSTSNQQAPSGSPSTAVAMIILYSITGVITALFLVIIVTGAIRAHRHPERYGPRNVLGRTRQSRAKGLARAMLDTLPIVKFGEKEEDGAKPGDVEMGNPKSVVSADGEDEVNERATSALGVQQKDAANTSSQDIAIVDGAAQSEEPAPATSEGDAPGCSICTEDFERGQDVRVLPCNHSFHPACIDPWLLNVSGTCPLCRIDLRPANEQEADPAAGDSNILPPPLDADAAGANGLEVPNNRSSRRISGFTWDIINPRAMARASREERIEALRRFRASRRQSTTEELESRRRRRLTGRLGEAFGVSTRPTASSTAGSTGPTSPSSSGPGSSTLAVHQDTEAGAVRSIAEESVPIEPTRAAAAPHTTRP